MARSRRMSARITDDDSSASGSRGRVSSRRSAVSGSRSSRRSSNRSSHKSSRTKGEGSGAAKEFFKAILVLILVAAVVAGGVAAYVTFKEKPRAVEVQLTAGAETYQGTRQELASRFLASARALSDQVQDAIGTRSPDRAEEFLADMQAYLNQPVLGHASPQPSADDENIADINLALQAADLMGSTEGFKLRIQELKESLAANDNKARLLKRTDKLDQLKGDDLDQLERDIEQFMANPVDPSAGSNEQYKQQYAGLIQQVEPKLSELQSFRVKLLMRETTDVSQAALQEAQRFMEKKQFSNAYDAVKKMAADNKGVDLQPILDTVVKGAEQGWSKEKTVATNRFNDAQAAGTDPAIARRTIQESINIFDSVIDSYGDSHPDFATYVREAKELKQKYQAAMP